MKKIILSLFLICLMSMIATAVPQMPYILYGKVQWNEQLLSGSRLQVTDVNTGYTKQVVTDGSGYWVEQLSEYSKNDVIQVKVLDGCGTGDICTKSITVGVAPTQDFAVVDFSITGTLVCPPVSCPSCGGGGGGGCYINQATKEKCNELFPCATQPIECPPEKVCDICETCSPDTVCTPEVCQSACPDCPEQNGITGLIAGIAAIILSIGGGIQIYKNRAGGITLLHRHKGYVGYHNADTQHNNLAIRHATFSKNPTKYLSDMKKIEETGSLI